MQISLLLDSSCLRCPTTERCILLRGFLGRAGYRRARRSLPLERNRSVHVRTRCTGIAILSPQPIQHPTQQSPPYVLQSSKLYYSRWMCVMMSRDRYIHNISIHIAIHTRVHVYIHTSYNICTTYIHPNCTAVDVEDTHFYLRHMIPTQDVVL